MTQFFANQQEIEEKAKLACMHNDEFLRMRWDLSNDFVFDYDDAEIVRWSEVGYRDFELDSAGELLAVYEPISRDCTECGYMLFSPVMPNV